MKELIEYGIDHVGFLVPNLGKTIEHMKADYGIKDVKYLAPYLEHCWTDGKPHAQQCKCAIVTLADNQCKMEFLEPVTEGGYHWDFVKSGGSGINHICFKVRDFDHWKARFEALGHEVFFGYEDEDEENGYRRCIYVRDPMLNMVYEIKEINRYRDAAGVLEP